MNDDLHNHAVSHRNVAVLVIGGTSHTGKSTLGHSLASDLGWRYLSTDIIARHPGRPFRGDGKVPSHVQAHYLNHTTHELIDNVVLHSVE